MIENDNAKFEKVPDPRQLLGIAQLMEPSNVIARSGSAGPSCSGWASGPSLSLRKRRRCSWNLLASRSVDLERTLHSR